MNMVWKNFEWQLNILPASWTHAGTTHPASILTEKQTAIVLGYQSCTTNAQQTCWADELSWWLLVLMDGEEWNPQSLKFSS